MLFASAVSAALQMEQCVTQIQSHTHTPNARAYSRRLFNQLICMHIGTCDLRVHENTDKHLEVHTNMQ